jgi:UDP-N-acetylmuramate: L-alanyl-gamma-D-glutamyl-meso-diaminopimelate ligase
LHTYSSLSEQFIDHYQKSLDPADEAVVFYDPHAVQIKKLELMPIDRIRSGFGKINLVVLSTKQDLLDYLSALETANTVLALMSSGSFNGLDRNDIIELFQ